MRKILTTVALTLVAAVAGAASTKAVTFQMQLDVAAPTAASTFSSTYVPVADKFLVGHSTSIEIFNGLTGTFESTLDITGILPSGLGFFALTAAEDGTIFGYESGGGDIWRWDSITDIVPDKVYDTIGSPTRIGYTSTSGNKRVIGFTGIASGGNVDFFSESFPYATGSFTFIESAPIVAKSGLAFNTDATVVYTVGDTGNLPINKFVNTAGVWAIDPTWVPPLFGGGPMAYDNTNDVLFVLRMTTTNLLVAIDGTTGDKIGEYTVANPTGNLSGYCGGWVQPSGINGTVWMAARGATASNATLVKLTYAVGTASSIEDWSLYKE